MDNKPRPLAADEVCVYFLGVKSAGQEDLFERYVRLLDAEERARRERFVFEKDRRLFVMAHGLTREALSWHTGLPPAEWCFVAGKNGRPELATPSAARAPRFNLSHTAGLVACALAWSREVGVDVEKRNRPGTDLAVADRYFSPSEVRWLREAPEVEQPDRFLILWTLKEAYIKAVGEGLSVPLDRFSVTTSGGELEGERGRASIAFEPPLLDHPDRWELEWTRLGTEHIAAVAARRAENEKIRVVWREASV